MWLRIPSSHGKDPDLLCLGAAVSQRQGHFPVGGAVCGVGPDKTQETNHRCQNKELFCSFFKNSNKTILKGTLGHCISLKGILWSFSWYYNGLSGISFLFCFWLYKNQHNCSATCFSFPSWKWLYFTATEQTLKILLAISYYVTEVFAICFFKEARICHNKWRKTFCLHTNL